MDRNIVTPADTARIVQAASDKADERAMLAARAVLNILSYSFRTFRPTLTGALEAIDDFALALRTMDPNNPMWRQIKAELEHLVETEQT